MHRVIISSGGRKGYYVGVPFFLLFSKPSSTKIASEKPTNII